MSENEASNPAAGAESDVKFVWARQGKAGEAPSAQGPPQPSPTRFGAVLQQHRPCARVALRVPRTRADQARGPIRPHAWCMRAAAHSRVRGFPTRARSRAPTRGRWPPQCPSAPTHLATTAPPPPPSPLPQLGCCCHCTGRQHAELGWRWGGHREWFVHWHGRFAPVVVVGRPSCNSTSTHPRRSPRLFADPSGGQPTGQPGHSGCAAGWAGWPHWAVVGPA